MGSRMQPAARDSSRKSERPPSPDSGQNVMSRMVGAVTGAVNKANEYMFNRMPEDFKEMHRKADAARKKKASKKP